VPGRRATIPPPSPFVPPSPFAEGSVGELVVGIDEWLGVVKTADNFPTYPKPRSYHLPDVEAHITGTVWKIEVEVGDTVEEGDPVVILESMKMEMPVEAEDSGVVKEIRCKEGQAVSEGDVLVVLE
jgi:acetyl-CoA carboxylase biotin carboxyl carrier protein